MKTSSLHSFITAGVIFILAAVSRCQAADPHGRAPILDKLGRFWVYRNGPHHPPMPFTPYGWMSDSSNDLTHILQVDLESRDRPYLDMNAETLPEKEYCIRVKINWGNATWVSVAFISGSDSPPWWGETDTGTHYNLSSLAKKRLVFFARGEHGGEAIRAQLGLLYDKPFGDSLDKPVRSEELKLGTDWTRYEIDLKNIPDTELAAVCNGFGIYAERASQPGTPSETQFYIDDVYFE